MSDLNSDVIKPTTTLDFDYFPHIMDEILLNVETPDLAALARTSSAQKKVSYSVLRYRHMKLQLFKPEDMCLNAKRTCHTFAFKGPKGTVAHLDPYLHLVLKQCDCHSLDVVRKNTALIQVLDVTPNKCVHYDEKPHLEHLEVLRMLQFSNVTTLRVGHGKLASYLSRLDDFEATFPRLKQVVQRVLLGPPPAPPGAPKL